MKFLNQRFYRNSPVGIFIASCVSFLLLGSAAVVGQDLCNFPADELGKKRPQMEMDLMGLKYQEIRDSMPSMSEITDEQMSFLMRSMGGDYYWPHSASGVDGTPGLLILAHGFGEEGDADLYNSMEAFSENYQTTVAYGMSMMSSRHIECSLFEMDQRGVGKTYIVPVSASPFNTLVRQWRYIFNLEDNYSYANVKKVDSKSAVFLQPIGDHPLVREIVLDFANEISSDPSNEVVLIVAHGPVSGEDNELQLAMMNNISSYLSESGGFLEVAPLTLQDDAPPEVRAANVQRMREFLSSWSDKGRDVLIVSNLMSGKGIQRRIEQDLEGLDYSFNPNGVATHALFREWIEISIQESLQ
jgi:hypothetical protein|tara:strand:+ start:2455 stop:3525 length:1071 start_codon:yes stop_codon:yes gene_type:complete